MNSQALTIRMLECEESKEQIATGILSALPAWFGCNHPQLMSKRAHH